MNASEHLTGKDLAIAVLTVTAVILFTAFAGVQVLTTRQAMGFAQNLPGDDYQLLTAQLDNTAEILLIVNKATMQMNAYAYDLRARRIVAIQQVDLTRLGGRRGPQAGTNLPPEGGGGP